MSRIRSNLIGVIGSGILLILLGSSSFASQTETIDVHVSIVATKSLSANTTYYDFGPLGVNTSSVSATATIITNDSASLIETYTLQAGDAISDTGGTDWSLALSTGPDQYSLSAQFSNTKPNDDTIDWTNDALTTSPQPCSQTQFGNGIVSESGSNVSPKAGINARSLWIRILTPSEVQDASEHTATMTIAVQ